MARALQEPMRKVPTDCLIALSSRDCGLHSVSCAQRWESKQAMESNSASLTSQDDKGLSFASKRRRQRQEGRVGPMWKQGPWLRGAGGLSYSATNRTAMSLLGLELTNKTDGSLCTAHSHFLQPDPSIGQSK